MLESKEVYITLREGNRESKTDLLRKFPYNTLKESAESFVSSSDPLTVLLGFGSLLPGYCHGASAVTAEVLGLSLYQYGKELFISSNYPKLFLMTILGYAHGYLTALINLGKYDIAKEFIEEEEKYWEIYENDPSLLQEEERSTFLENLKSLWVAKVQVLINLNEFDDALDLAKNDEKILGNPASDIELHRLRKMLKEMKMGVGELDKDDNQRREESDDQQKSSTDTMLDSLGKMIDKSGYGTGLTDKLKGIKNIDPYSQSGFSELENMLSKGESFLQKDTSEINELTLKQAIRRASGIFVDNQPTKDQISESEGKLKTALASARKLNIIPVINDALYGLYLCNSRLSQFSEAADYLIEIRKNLEVIRKGIKNPLERGGVFQKYPYLFYSMVEYLFKTGRFTEMLDAIEGSKGRAITDSLEKESSLDMEEFDLLNIHSRLKPLLSRENAHYVSYHVDDEYSYVCIIAKSGEVYTDRVSIGKPDLEKYYKKQLNDPTAWQQQIVKVDIKSELYPFISLIEDLIKKGKIDRQDHICYSPDHLLYLFPLHYFKIENEYLIELCTLSRVHNAGHLISLLSKPVKRQIKCLSVEVPSSSDGEEMISEIGKSPLFLGKIFSSNYQNLYQTDSSIENFLLKCEAELLIHFSTHGFFPQQGNPYENSGLLLAYNNQLPELQLIDPNYNYNQEGLHLLSPERLMQSENINFENSHVTIQACVAGYAREGIGGDALGIEWAFFQKGSTSMVSSFWNIDINNANNFYKIFYNEWLNNGSTKALAHQNAVLSLKESSSSDILPHEYFWAGFGLIGDWR